MGIRDAAAVDALAGQAGLALVAEVAMPANNHCRIWRRTRAATDGGLRLRDQLIAQGDKRKPC